MWWKKVVFQYKIISSRPRLSSFISIVQKLYGSKNAVLTTSTLAVAY